MPKLSIIVPIYNVEKYLKRCLDSILTQTFKDFELILINDASTDSSQLIVDEYKKKDSRIISIINKENSGAGKTRNVGLSIAKGEYVTFVDSDDWIEKEMYKEMLDVMIKNQVDLVECNAQRPNEKNLYIKNLIHYFKKIDFTTNEYIYRLTKQELGVVVWNKIYNVEIINKNYIRFGEYKNLYGEDLLFNIFYMHYVKTIITINKPLYYYYNTEGSASNNDYYNLEKISNYFNCYISQNKKFNNFESDFFELSIIMTPIIKASIMEPMRNSKHPIKAGSSILNIIEKDKIMNKCLKCCLKNKNASYKNRLFSLLIILKMPTSFLIIFSIFQKFKKFSLLMK